MPIKIPDNLPARESLLSEAVDVINSSYAERQDIRPLKLLSLDAALSFGNWVWGEDVDASFSSDYDRTNTVAVQLYTDGLKVGFQAAVFMFYSRTAV